MFQKHDETIPKKSLRDTFNEKVWQPAKENVLKPAKVMFVDPFIAIVKKVRHLKKGDLTAFFNKVAHLKPKDVKAAWRKVWPVIKDTWHDLTNLKDPKSTVKEIGIFLTLNLFPYPFPSIPYALYRVGKYKLKQAAANDNHVPEIAPADEPATLDNQNTPAPKNPENVIIRRRNPSP